MPKRPTIYLSLILQWWCRFQHLTLYYTNLSIYLPLIFEKKPPKLEKYELIFKVSEFDSTPQSLRNVEIRQTLRRKSVKIFKTHIACWGCHAWREIASLASIFGHASLACLACLPACLWLRVRSKSSAPSFSNIKTETFLNVN